MGVLQDVSKWHWCSGLVTQTFGARRERPDARGVGDTACGTLPWAGGIFLWNLRVVLTGKDQTHRAPLGIAGHGSGWAVP